MENSWVFRGLIWLIMMVFWNTPGYAQWSWNLGYQNPYTATYGINLLYKSRPLSLELGLGWVDGQTKDTDSKEDQDKSDQPLDKDTANILVAGDLDLKYFFAEGTVQPFMQGGVGYGLGASAGKQNDIGFSVGDGFGGLGLFVDAKAFYLYGSVNANRHLDLFVQGGIGFPF